MADSFDFSSGFSSYEENLGIKLLKTEFTCDVAQELFDRPALDVSLMYDYQDHDDTYQDVVTPKFVSWYLKDFNSEICKLFMVGSIESYHLSLLEGTKTECAFSLTDYKGSFRSNRLGIFTDTIKNSRISGDAPPRLGRILNVFIREHFPADAGYLVATQPLGKRFPPCRNCGSVFDSETGETLPGETWLKLTDGGGAV